MTDQGLETNSNYQPQGIGSYLDSGIPEVDVRATFTIELY